MTESSSAARAGSAKRAREPSRRARAVRCGLLVAALAGGVGLVLATDLPSVLADGETLQARIRALGPLGPAGIMLAIALAIVVSPLPSAPIALAAGAAYGHTWGTVYVATGAPPGRVMIAVLVVGAFMLAPLLYQLVRRPRRTRPGPRAGEGRSDRAAGVSAAHDGTPG